MFGKGVVTIAAIGVIACVLLVMRQQRLRAAYELAAAAERIVEHQRMQASLRAEIAHRTTPDLIDDAAMALGIRTIRGAQAGLFAWEDPAFMAPRSDQPETPFEHTD